MFERGLESEPVGGEILFGGGGGFNKFQVIIGVHRLSSGGGGGGYSNFFRIRRLGPSIYCSTPKNIRKFKHPKKIFEIFATQKNIPILYLDLKKDPKLNRNDPQTSPIL